MELEGSASPTWSNLNRFSESREPSASASHPPPPLPAPPLDNMSYGVPRRFPGDGFDFRRPVTSSTIIDLTDEDAGPSAAPSDPQRTNARPPRPPRFGREIMQQDVIDLEAEDTARPTATSGSPEIEFVSSRRIDPSQRPSQVGAARSNPDEDEVEFVRENRLPDAPRRLFQLYIDNPGEAPHLRAAIERQIRDREHRHHSERNQAHEHRRTAERQRAATIHRFLSRLNGPQAPPRRRGPRIHFVAPNLDFGAVGFDMGYEFEADHSAEPTPTPPTYSAPDAAPEGFTRSPQEEDVLICPNCNRELCAGISDLQRQVWLVKGCGHVSYQRTGCSHIG